MNQPPEDANARVQPGERVTKLTNSRRLGNRRLDVNKTYGPPKLCGWQVVPGMFWIQTTEPCFSRKLEKRADVRRVAVDGLNHYRHTFELQGTWRKIRRIVDSYLMSAGDQLSPDFPPASASQIAPSINTAGNTKEGKNGQK